MEHEKYFVLNAEGRLHLNRIHNLNCIEGLKLLPDNCVDCCVTSPPYFGLRDYGTEEQIGMEQTPDEFVDKLLQVFTEVKRILKPNGTLWLNLGDSYWGGKGMSGARDAEYQEQRNLNGESINAKHQQTGGKGKVRPTDRKHPIIKAKDLVGMPWMVAFALRASGWYLRQDIIWAKPNPMPESMTDRCTKAHEYIFLMSKSKEYYYDSKAIEEPCVWDTGGLTEKRVDRADENHKAMPTTLKNGIRPKKKGPQTFGGKKARDGQENGGDIRNGHRTDESSQWGKVWDSEKPTRNKRSVWNVATKPFREAHFATFPEDLIVDCIKAGCPIGGVVLDPFMGAGTTAVVSRKLNRNFIGFELNKDYISIATKRLNDELGFFL